VYVYVCMYVCVCVCVCVLYIYIYMCVCVCVCVSECMYVCVFVCTGGVDISLWAFFYFQSHATVLILCGLFRRLSPYGTISRGVQQWEVAMEMEAKKKKEMYRGAREMVAEEITACTNEVMMRWWPFWWLCWRLPISVSLPVSFSTLVYVFLGFCCGVCLGARGHRTLT